MRTLITLVVLAMAVSASAQDSLTFSWLVAPPGENWTSVQVFRDSGDNMVGENFDLIDEDGRNYITVPNATDGMSHRYFARACNEHGCSGNSNYADVHPEFPNPEDPPPVEQQIPPTTVPGFQVSSITLVPVE